MRAPACPGKRPPGRLAWCRLSSGQPLAASRVISESSAPRAHCSWGPAVTGTLRMHTPHAHPRSPRGTVLAKSWPSFRDPSPCSVPWAAARAAPAHQGSTEDTWHLGDPSRCLRVPQRPQLLTTPPQGSPEAGLQAPVEEALPSTFLGAAEHLWPSYPTAFQLQASLWDTDGAPLRREGDGGHTRWQLVSPQGLVVSRPRGPSPKSPEGTPKAGQPGSNKVSHAKPGAVYLCSEQSVWTSGPLHSAVSRRARWAARRGSEHHPAL